jgi:hypothetical protein
MDTYATARTHFGWGHITERQLDEIHRALGMIAQKYAAERRALALGEEMVAG